MSFPKILINKNMAACLRTLLLATDAQEKKNTVDMKINMKQTCSLNNWQ